MTNVHLFRTVPQAAGVPLLVIPIGGEQRDNASRVVYLGVGLRAEPATLTAGTVRRQVRRILDEPSFRIRAQQCAEQLRRAPGVQAASAAITALVEETCWTGYNQGRS